MRAILNNFLLLSLVIFICGCSEKKTIEIVGEVNVMKLPYPDGHVAELQAKNSVVIVLTSGRIEVVDEWAEKDFYAYEIRTSDGQKGFVFGGDNIKDKAPKY